MKKTLLAAIALASSVLAFSNTALAEGPGWIYNATVVRVVNTSNGGINVAISPGLGSCTSQSGYGPGYAWVPPTHPGLNRIKADLITALVTGTVVSLYLGDNTCQVVETVLGSF